MSLLLLLSSSILLITPGGIDSTTVAPTTATSIATTIFSTTAVVCADTLSNCESQADMCMNKFAYDQMVRDCIKTCNACPGQCEDLGTDCPDRARDGYCDRAIYTDLMAWQCPKSCNRCGDRRPRLNLPVVNVLSGK